MSIYGFVLNSNSSLLLKKSTHEPLFLFLDRFECDNFSESNLSISRIDVTQDRFCHMILEDKSKFVDCICDKINDVSRRASTAESFLETLSVCNNNDNGCQHSSFDVIEYNEENNPNSPFQREMKVMTIFENLILLTG